MDNPVVIVHGYADTNRSPWWKELESRLVESGYDKSDVYLVDFSIDAMPGSSIDSPQKYAEKLKERIDQILREKKSEDCEETEEVDIIAHSMGGLDARWYIEKMDGADNVNKLITLGTPHKGTEMANLAAWTPGARDMIPDSDFLRELNSSHLPEDVEYVSIWSRGDELVVPSERAKLEDAKNINPGFYTHIVMVRSPEVFRDAILPALRGEGVKNKGKRTLISKKGLNIDIT